ncbi:MAG: glycosyltransferase family 39 protein, partial [Deltaproteobacteria bacterium]|nr:glycosyltransferase family 39 protein [Deltaproteobacteria bacterium]
MSEKSSIQPSPSTVRVAQLALVFAAINALEPIHLDDAAFFLFAQHIAQTPLDPYGFSLIWDGEFMSAMNILAPPVFLYYWAGLIKLFGSTPLVWKLGCFPIYFLYIASLRTIISRFAPSILWPAVLLIAFSPIVLPGANMMLELPVQSLFFAGLACFMLACERGSLRLLALSAVSVALCIEAKYTGLIIIPTLALY